MITSMDVGGSRVCSYVIILLRSYASSHRCQSAAGGHANAAHHGLTVGAVGLPWGPHLFELRFETITGQVPTGHRKLHFSYSQATGKYDFRWAGEPRKTRPRAPGPLVLLKLKRSCAEQLIRRKPSTASYSMSPHGLLFI